MILFPAVDIQNGQAVRLKQGRKEDVTVFADNPLDMARRWADLGASWLHVIDLDGAFDGKCVNAGIIGSICRELDMPVQVGGGIRSMDSVRQYLDAGVTRLIIGTLALENPDEFARMCHDFPGKIGVSLDARDGRLKSRGWVADTDLTVADVVPRMADAGASFIIYTDISRDGTREGLNLAALENLLGMTSLPVIAAGGVASLEDVKAVAALRHHGNLEGVISGRALYDGSLDFREASRILSQNA